MSLFLAACEDPAANKPQATVNNDASNSASTSNTANVTNTAPADVNAEILAISPENSKVEFVGSKVTGKHDGGFKEFTGDISLVDGKAEGSSVVVDIEAASVFTDTEQLTEHLRTGDFFEVEKYPKASFRSTKIVADAAKGGNNYTVTGDLELRGQKRSITFPATIEVTDSKVDVDAEFSIDRKEFGIVYAGQADDLIRDLVVIKLDLNVERSK